MDAGDVDKVSYVGQSASFVLTEEAVLLYNRQISQKSMTWD